VTLNTFKAATNFFGATVLLLCAMSASSFRVWGDQNVAPLGSFSGGLLYLQNGDIWHLNLSEKTRKRVTIKQTISRFSLSYDGKLIVYAENNRRLYAYDLVSGKHRFLIDVDLPDVTPIAIAPSNQGVAYIAKSQSRLKKRPT
jgi:hypothetical protein